MRKVTVSVLLCLLFLLPVSLFSAASQAASAPSGDFRSVADLALRVVPWLSPNLVFKSLPRDHGNDVFELETADGKLVIRASSPSSAAMGLNWYLKYYCHRSISHLGNNVAPVSPIPTLPHPVRRTSRFKHRYYLNYCTLNYTHSWATWEQWQRELDWMALNGINLALATNGNEAVWQNTLRRMGYTEQEILEFIPGPAFTAWWLMGNLEGWGGPVTQRMIDDASALQKKVVARMRELDIEPVMQGFYGMVPASTAKKFPTAKIVDQGDWGGGFRRPQILLSSDPLFARMAAIYYEETKKLYGPARYFGGDLFHEGGKTEGLDVPKLAGGVQNEMLRANPEAIWVLQGWLDNPKDALLDGLQLNRTLVINLESPDWEKRKAFHGSPWVWGIINNFGENVGMFGDMRRVASEPVHASASPYGKELIGIGALMEGIDNNPVLYDLLFEMAWHDEAVDLKPWIHDYAQYRYGRTTPAVDRAWELLLDTVYTSGAGQQSIFCARPALNVQGASTWGNTNIGYDPAKLEEAAKEFLSAAPELRANDTYKVDTVDISRQVLANRGLATYRKMVAAFQAKDKDAFHQSSNEFLALLRAQDELLATRKEFMLGTWLEAAKAMARTDAERALYEKNARTQITYWGPDNPTTELHDYANKEWSGLLRDFYLPRWEMFIADLNAQLDGKPATEVNYFKFEKHWTEQHNQFPAKPVGDPVAAAKRALASSGAEAK